MSRVRDIANILSGSTDMATDAEVTSSIASHAAAADPHTVYLKTATASSTYAPLSNPTFTTIGGDEGGQINLGAAATNTTLSGNIALDINQNRLRIFESAGNNRGAYVDLTTLSNGVGSELITAAPQSGNSGKYLTTDGTNASWGTISAGGMTLLGTGSMSGASSVTFSSISQSYNRLYVRFSGVTGGASFDEIYMRVNGISGAACYTSSMTNNTSTTITNNSLNYIRVSIAATGIYSFTGGMYIHDYTNTSSNAKTINWNVGGLRNGSNTYLVTGVADVVGTSASSFDGCGAISSILFYNNNGNNFSAGNIYLYGEK